MYQKCPNCAEFKYTEVTEGKWEMSLLHFLPYFYASYLAFGSPFHDTLRPLTS